MYKTVSLLTLTFIISILSAQVTSVTNISATQRNDGSMIVDIYFDLSGSEPEYIIKANVSFDLGINYSPCHNVAGDVGPEITPGISKHIIWYFGTELPDRYSSLTQIKINAYMNLPWFCGDTIMDARDGQIYNTIGIGDQCWMAENLNFGSMINEIHNMSNNGIIEKYCYENSTSNCNVYGGLYQWNEIMEYSTNPGIRGICPNGWHIPTDNEWCIMENVVDSGTIFCNWTGWQGIDVGGNLKEAGFTHWNCPNEGGANSSGFSALPAGLRHSITEKLISLNEVAFWWTSTYFGSHAYRHTLSYLYNQISRDSWSTNSGYSIRCLKDEPIPNIPPNIPANPIPTNGEVDVNINEKIFWSCSDPNKDILSYNIYLGELVNLTLVASAHQDTFYFPSTLSYNTEYFWKIVAYDVHGDSTVGPIWSFTTIEAPWLCGDTLIDTRDDQKYRTVTIGNQCWMTKNLNIGSMIIGTQNMSNDGNIEKYCYENNPSYCDTYGGLYQWEEVMGYSNDTLTQGICPDGWHIPTDYEWMVLEGTVDSQYPVGHIEWTLTAYRGFDVGLNLKSNNGWSNNGNGTDLYNFTAMPGGVHDMSSGFISVGSIATWWSSSIANPPNIWARSLLDISDYSLRTSDNKSQGVSLRCIKGSHPPTLPANPVPPNGVESIDILIDTTLQWTCSDPDGDELSFNVYLGDNPNPPLVITHHPDTFYNPGILNRNTIYYWKIVAFDIHGDSTIGSIWNFKTSWTCGIPVMDTRDGQIYNTVLIEDQCWMAENLNIGSMINGSQNMSDNGVIEKYCHINIIDRCNTYGAYYQWNEAMGYSTIPNVEGICPQGWCIPTDDDWNQLEIEVDTEYNFYDLIWGTEGFRGYNSGLNLKATSSWNGGGYGPDTVGFGALATERRFTSGGFSSLGNNAYWWSSTEYSSSTAWNRHLYYNFDNSDRDNSSKNYGQTIRCIKKDPNQPPLVHNNSIPNDGASDVNVYGTALSWSCSDPNKDTLSYDIYLGELMNLVLVASAHQDTFYFPSTLSYNAKYFWQIVAFDIHGDSIVGPLWYFMTIDAPWLCGDTLIDTRDGQKYSTVAIGNQCWMTENLNIGSMIFGTQNMSNDGIIEKYCYYDIIDMCNTYGGLYQWEEVMDYSNDTLTQGICPDGWHIPADYEWMVLEGTVDSQYPVEHVEWTLTGYRGFDVGLNLKSTNGWSNNSNGSDLYNFSAMPGGVHDMSSGFVSIGSIATWWSSSIANSPNIWARSLVDTSDNSLRTSDNKSQGVSLRCVKGIHPPTLPSNPIPHDGSEYIHIDTTLQWAFSDPNGDEFSYNIYFGDNPNPPLVITHHPDTFYNPGILDRNTIYYWKIVAFDTHGDSTIGPTWNFKTENYIVPMVEVNGGTFQLNGIYVTISNFHISQFEISYAQFITFLNDINCNSSGYFNDSTFGFIEYIDINDNDCAIAYDNGFYFSANQESSLSSCPVTEVSWYGANAYCIWAGGRLPTEAEWEIAARGANLGIIEGTYFNQWAGTNTQNQLFYYAWYIDNSNSQTNRVGSKQANELGLFDMTGNVKEWCGDWYGSTFPYSNDNPIGPTTGTSRVIRGGSWLDYSDNCTVNHRESRNPDDSFGNIGFRLVIQ